MRACLGDVVDPRVAGRTWYPLDEVLVIAFIAVLCDPACHDAVPDAGGLMH